MGTSRVGLDGRMDPVDSLIIDEWNSSGHTPARVITVDAPDLAAEAASRGISTLAFCDDLRDERRVPPGVTLVTPDDALEPVPSVVLMRLPKAARRPRRGRRVVGPGHRARQCAVRRRPGQAPDPHHERRVGRHFIDVTASLGRQKSRVLRASGPTPAPATWPRTRHHDDLGLTLSAHGGVFADVAVDPGTRLLLGALDAIVREPVERAVDLGSGNGVIAALLARRLAPGSVEAVDVSWAAVRASAETCALNGVDVRVHRADGFGPFADHSLDLVVTNPPFHVGTAKESTPTLEMFVDAARALRPGGRFWCVFNSHLPWARTLNDLGPTRIIARTPKYTLTRTTAR